MSSQPNITNMPFDRKSPGHPQGGVLNCQTWTDRQTDIATLWDDSAKRKEKYFNHVMHQVLCVTCHLAHVTFHMTTPLCSFSCYESPRRFGDTAAGGLVTDRVLFLLLSLLPKVYIFLCLFWIGQYKEEPMWLKIFILSN